MEGGANDSITAKYPFFQLATYESSKKEDLIHGNRKQTVPPTVYPGKQ
jgi:hypothetical protein